MLVKDDGINVWRRLEANTRSLRRDAISVSDDILSRCMSALIDLDESGGSQRSFERRSDQISRVSGQ